MAAGLETIYCVVAVVVSRERRVGTRVVLSCKRHAVFTVSQPSLAGNATRAT